MQRPSFIVVTGIVSALAGFAFVARILSSYVEKPVNPILASSPMGFLRQAATQSIDWRPFDPKELAKARSLNRPILLVVGSAASGFGRMLDNTDFEAKEVQALLKAKFVTIRVDKDDDPRWGNAILPLRRVTSPLSGDTYVAALDGDGRVLGTLFPSGPREVIDPRTFVRFLNQIESSFGNKVSLNQGKPNQDQEQDLNNLGLRTDALPDFEGYYASTYALAKSSVGGFPIGGIQEVRPSLWRGMLVAGRVDAFRQSIDPFLVSPTLSLMDGVAFRRSHATDWSDPEFDVSSVMNADLATTLAMGSVLSGEKWYADLSKRLWTGLRAECTDGNGLIAGFAVGKEFGDRRHPRYSLNVRQIRNRVPDNKERDWVHEHFNLRPGVSPSMVPHLVNPADLADQKDMVNRMLTKLSESLRPRPEFGAQSYLDVNASVCLRAIETSEILGDDELKSWALNLAARIDAVRTEDDVVHDVNNPESNRFLTDYLAYAELQWILFRTDGRLPPFRAGLRVLNRALDLFDDPDTGLLHLAPATEGLPAWLNPPEILDTQRESAMATATRVAWLYGITLGGPEGEALVRRAQGWGKRVGPFIGGGPSVAAWVTSARRVSDNLFLVCVGKDQLDQIRLIRSRRPDLVVFPSFANLRPDLRNAPAGVYVFLGSRRDGPFSADQALASVPAP